MSHPRAKICGLTSAADRDAAIAAGADAVGFITDVPVESPRELAVEEVVQLARGVTPFVTSVLVTMPDSVQAAVDLQERVRADAVQIHGGLAPEYVGGLRERLDADVVAAVDTEQSDALAYAEAADMLLVDTTAEGGAGGTGETHDWERTRDIVAATETPVMLAGGLTPGNVREAIETVDPYAVDTATGVEQADTPGRKDPEAVRAFLSQVRGVES